MFTIGTADKKLEIKVNIPESQIVYVDKNALMTIVRNLLDNAIKYTDKKGIIRLISESSPNGVIIKIEDTGTGMSPNKIKDIFLFDDKKSEVGTKGEKGTGLGLYLINELVKLNNGTIDVQSQIGKGTTFRIVLPVN